MRKFFYDTEFNEGVSGNSDKPTIDLISIGIVDENGKSYYAISNTFDLNGAWWKNDNTIAEPVYWLRENVLRKIFNELAVKSEEYSFDLKDDFKIDNLYGLLREFGKTNFQIANEIIEFINPSKQDPIELYGYYSAYDHVVLCWLFGRMIDLPEGMPMYTIDLKQEIDNISKRKSEMFKISFDEALKSIKDDKQYPEQSDEHNALYDSIWNLKLYNFLNRVLEPGYPSFKGESKNI